MSERTVGPRGQLQTTSIEIRRMLPAPPAAVFRAWTNPELMRQWLSPLDVAAAEVDLRVGGHLRLVMAGPGVTIEHTGVYLEIDPPRRLSFTWCSPYTGDEPSVVTVVLVPRRDGTELVLTHERLPQEAATSHRSGWGQMLDRLDRELAARVRR